MAAPIVNVNGFATSVPTDTTQFHQKGEVILNSEPSVNEPFGWVCVADGRPGTWQALDSVPHGALYNTVVTVSAAELAALRATPKTLVSAPGAGYVLKFEGATLLLDYTAPAFTETADNFVIRYNNGSGVAVSDVIENTGFIDQTADMITHAVPVKDPIVSKANGENKALVLHNNGDGELAGGGGSAVRVVISYRIVPTGF